jgi:hypothetical protein
MFADDKKKTVELRSLDSRGRLSPHGHLKTTAAAAVTRVEANGAEEP